MFECRYSKRIWTDVFTWLKCPALMQCIGVTKGTIFEYWKDLAAIPSPSRGGLKTAIVLITWEI